MDCFYAAVEMRETPSLRGRPIAVGGQPSQRGVIATSNYEARKFGVRSALASSQALKKCPQLVILPPRFDLYKKVSRQIHEIFTEYTSKIEPLSLDEAFLDVTDCEAFYGSATYIAQAIKEEIKNRTQLTASAGVAPNKLIAKIATDLRKPDGIVVVRPDQIDEFISPLPVGKLFGVGKVTEKKLNQQGIKTCKDLQNYPLHQLSKIVGRWAETLWKNAHGIDNRPVQNTREAKSFSIERTFAEDLSGEAILQAIEKLFPQFWERYENRKSRLKGIRGLQVKVKFSDFTSTTVSDAHMKSPTRENFLALFETALNRKALPVRLLGLGVILHSSPTPKTENKSQLSWPFVGDASK